MKFFNCVKICRSLRSKLIKMCEFIWFKNFRIILSISFLMASICSRFAWFVKTIIRSTRLITILSRVRIEPVKNVRDMNHVVVFANCKIATICWFFCFFFAAFVWSFCCRNNFSCKNFFFIILLQLITYNHLKNLWYYFYQIHYRWIVFLTF